MRNNTYNKKYTNTQTGYSYTNKVQKHKKDIATQTRYTYTNRVQLHKRYRYTNRNIIVQGEMAVVPRAYSPSWGIAEATSAKGGTHRLQVRLYTS